ncbi:MAG: hypothetical protein CMM30_06925 [Rhodospirillaceae bacterium]|nr:hypothetical protein [Rhodospirillaceae bacterium]|tara:strand:- start:906 stop:1661 length:756 start_codon:yes stop_codon:yes gene_type:complete
MRLEGKVSIITGSSRGIGKSIALRFSREGCKVAIVSARDPNAAQAVVDEIEKDGGIAAPFCKDISEVAQCFDLVEEVVSIFGDVDILVNNAGVFKPKLIEETSENDWDQQINTNLKASFFMVQALVPSMKLRRSGKIINITSIAADIGFQNSSAYCASKGGQGNMTRAMCLELAPYGINVNSIAPGNIKTDMNKHLRDQLEYDAIQASKTPSGIGHIDPEELCGAAVYLASGESNSTHGTSIVIDGGWSAW